MIQPLIAAVEQQYTKDKVPDFQIGDTVAVHVRIREGDKVRTQQFKGDVIARRGRGVGETFTVRHIDPNSQGVERISRSIHQTWARSRSRVRARSAGPSSIFCVTVSARPASSKRSVA